MTSINADKVATHSFDWGIIKWYVSPGQEPWLANITFGEVILLPGEGHTRHNHPTSEEILYVLSGTGEQMVDDKPSFPVHPGDTIYIPTAVFHSTISPRLGAAQGLLAIYNPGLAPERRVERPARLSGDAGRTDREAAARG